MPDTLAGEESPREGPSYPREAAQMVLSQALQGSDAAADAAGDLDLFHGGHRTLARAIHRLRERGKPHDVPMVLQNLRVNDELEAVGGEGAVWDLFAFAATDQPEPYIEELREAGGRRRLREALRAADLDVSEHDSAGEALARIEDRLRAVREELPRRDGDGLRSAEEILDDPDARIRPVTVAELLSWAGLLVLLAGREKDGKSTLLRWAAARRSAGLAVWHEEPTPTGPLTVLYWGQERAVDIAADLDRMGAGLERVFVRDMRLHPGDRFATLREDLDRVQPDLVVIDCLSTFTDRMDLDPGSAADWEPVMNRLAALAQESAAGFVLNHHARKSDGSYRDSTAIGAGVDAILELRRDLHEGETVRKVGAKARSAVPARDFKYHLTGSDASPRLELLDGGLSIEERVQRFVQGHRDCSQRDVLDGVRGDRNKLRKALGELSEDGGPLVCDDTSIPYKYRIAQDPQENGERTEKERSENGDTGNGGESVLPDPPRPVRGGGRRTHAEPVEEES